MKTSEPVSRAYRLSRTHVFCLVVALYLIVSLTSPKGQQSIMGPDLVIVSSSLPALLLGPAVFSLCVARQQPTRLDESPLPVTIWERMSALLIDFASVVVVTIPLISLPGLLLEWQATGTFSWAFEREFMRATDIVSGALFLVILPVLYGYFVTLPRRGYATIGQYIMGYRIVPLDDFGAKPQYFHRVILSYFLICCILAWGYLFRQDEGVYWWERKTHTIAMRTTYTEV